MGGVLIDKVPWIRPVWEDCRKRSGACRTISTVRLGLLSAESENWARPLPNDWAQARRRILIQGRISSDTNADTHNGMMNQALAAGLLYLRGGTHSRG